MHTCRLLCYYKCFITTVAVTVVTVLVLLMPPIPILADTLPPALLEAIVTTDVALVCHELFESSDDEEWLGFGVFSVVLLAIFQLR